MSATISRNTIPNADRPRAKRLLRAITPRSTGFQTAKPGAIELALASGHRQVFLTGPAAVIPPPFFGAWQLVTGYNEAGRAPVWTYTHQGNGKVCDIVRGSQWFGTDATSSECEAAWTLLNTLVGQTFPGGATLLTSPGATGRDLWQRTIPKGVEYVTPPADLADLIRTTSGQGRIEVCPADENIADLYEMDGRLMYLALMRELPGNLIEHATNTGRGVDLLDSLHDRARYLITVTVPIDWTHVGLVGVKDDRGRWRYPSFPGERFSTWVDGVELALISKWWGLHSVDIHQRLLFERGRPLDNLARAIMRLLDQVNDPFHPVANDYTTAERRAAAAGLRAIALHTIGALVGKPRPITNTRPLIKGRPTEGEQHRIVGDRWEWTTHEPARLPHLTQPHMSAAVWARARARLLDGPGQTGALHLPRHEIVAFRTDAIYTTALPDWHDDGRPGRYRLKKHSPGPMLAPHTQTELLTQRDGAF